VADGDADCPVAGASAINYGTAGRLGVIIPSGNTAVEPQFEALRPRGVSCHYARLTLTGSSPAQLLAMPRKVEEAAQLLQDAHVDLIAFHCTAVSTWDEALEDDILRRIEASTGVAAVATSRTLVAALRALCARRIVMLSPYLEHIALREQTFLERRGFEVVHNGFLGLSTPDEMLAVSPQQWLTTLCESPLERVDACVVSCTAVRAIEVVRAAEERLGIPVVTSNSAMLWFAASTLAPGVAIPAIGRLGQLALP
jgi:maleate isomerase